MNELSLSSLLEVFAELGEELVELEEELVEPEVAVVETRGIIERALVTFIRLFLLRFLARHQTRRLIRVGANPSPQSSETVGASGKDEYVWPAE
jgi:hypothetical protein